MASAPRTLVPPRARHADPPNRRLTQQAQAPRRLPRPHEGQESPYYASGFLGQYVVVVPAFELVVVRIGETPLDQRDRVAATLTDLVAFFEG